MSAGRPRAFCTAQALDKALKVFWEKGYEGASLQDLTEAMGINRPSLYAAYGNKESLFLKAIERYVEKHSGFMCHLDEADARKGIEGLLNQEADMYSDPCTPSGCLIVREALGCSDSASRIREALSTKKQQYTDMLASRLQRARAEGQLPKHIDPMAFSRYVSAVSCGLSVLADDGVSREHLREVVGLAMKAWPVEK